MSGVALTIRSPSISRMRRRVVCVAGCCGPKLRVQVNCLASAASSGSSSKLAGMDLAPAEKRVRTQREPIRSDPIESKGARSRAAASRLPTREAREVVPFAPSPERIILPQRVGGELVGHQDSPEVGVPRELDPVHVENLTLHPVG